MKSWLKKLFSASVLTSLFFIAPEKVQAESYLPSGLYNTGGYQLFSLAQNMNNVGYCVMPSTCGTPSLPTVPVVSIPPLYIQPSYGSSVGWGGNCGTFTQSCAPIYATTGFGGCGTLPAQPPITYQPLPSLPPPTLTYLPVFSVGMPSIPMPYDNSYLSAGTRPLSYGGCNNFVVACAQPSVNPYANLFPPSPFTGSGSGVGTSPGVILPRVYQVPRGVRTH
jgi:hypothetical protein